jgi:hypothetical protein
VSRPETGVRVMMRSMTELEEAAGTRWSHRTICGTASADWRLECRGLGERNDCAARLWLSLMATVIPG